MRTSLAANPDLILAEDIVSEEAIIRLREIGFPLVELKNSNLTMIRENILLIGRITEHISKCDCTGQRDRQGHRKHQIENRRAERQSKSRRCCSSPA